RVVEKNEVVLPDGTDADVFAMAADELEASVQVFHVRDGRVRGQRGWVVEKVEEVDDGELVERLLQQVYGDIDTTDGDGTGSRTGAGRARRPPRGRGACGRRRARSAPRCPPSRGHPRRPRRPAAPAGSPRPGRGGSVRVPAAGGPVPSAGARCRPRRRAAERA